MNPLNSNIFNNSYYQNNQYNINNLQSNARNIKQMMKMANGNFNVIFEQNPQIRQIMQMYKGQNLQNVYMNKCKSMNIDPNVILNELLN